MIAAESRGIIAKINSGTIVPVSKAIAAINNETDPVRLASVAMALDAAKKMDRKNVERRDYYGELAIFTGKRLGELIIAGQKAGLIETGKGRRTKASDRLTLTDIVPNRDYASRCYKLVEIEDQTIKGYVAQCKSEGSEITKAGVQRFSLKKLHLSPGKMMKMTSGTAWQQCCALLMSAKNWRRSGLMNTGTYLERSSCR